MVTETKLVPPDGGWGWIIILATALNNIITIPIMQGFGILFKNKFTEYGISATEATIIINFNFAFGMLLGLVNGPLLRKFGFRKVSLFSATIYAVGVFLTAFARTFTDFLITYGIIASLGVSLSTASFQLAINTYFRKRRNKAVGYAMTLTGLGPVFMPYVIGFSMIYYGVQGTLIILSALATHSIASALLLQPVKWHAKREIFEVEEGEKLLDEKKVNGEISIKPKASSEIGSLEDIDTASLYGYESAASRRNSIDSTANTQDRVRKISRQKSNTEKMYTSNVSLTSNKYYLDSKIIEEAEDINVTDSELDAKTNDEISNYNLVTVNPINNINNEENKNIPESWFKLFLHRVVLFFDLDLLTDMKYVSLMLGMSVAVFAEINFSLLTPFILNDFSFTTEQIATVMSIIGILDIVFRFISPFIGDYFKLSAKVMYMFSMVLLICSRSSILFYQTYPAMLVIAVLLGISKGFRTVYMSLVIPSYVPLEKLAAASGLQMVVNGIILLGAGPILGIIRDRTGSYMNCIIIINFVTFITLTFWTVEYIINYYLKNKKK